MTSSSYSTWQQSSLRALVLAASVLCLVSGVRPAFAEGPWGWDGFHAKQAPASSAQVGTLPTMQAEALDKTTLIVPTQLQGHLNLLLLCWARDQSPQLDTWTAVGQALQHSHTDFRVYRMPVSEEENFIFQWWDNASLRAAETDPELLHWDVPLYTDKAALVRAIGLPKDEKQVVALLVDPSGKILWKAQGSSTAQTRASLIQAAGGIR